MLTRLVQHFWLLVEFFVFWLCGLFSWKYSCRLRFELRKMCKSVEFDHIRIDDKITELEKCKTAIQLERLGDL